MNVRCAPIPYARLRELNDCVKKKGIPGDTKCHGIADRTIQQIGEDHDLLGTGVGRTVFLLGNSCVLKITNGLDEAYGNRTEARSWGTIERNNYPEKRLFAPVLSHSKHGTWLVMRAATEIGTIDEDDMADKLYEFGVECPDLHEQNIGKLNGKPVVIDYEGCRKRRR